MSENNHIPVFFHSSDEYSPVISVVMASILSQTTSYIDFFVIETGISNFHKRQIENMKEKFPNFSITWIPFTYNDIFRKEYFEKIHEVNKERPAWPSIHGYCTPFIPLLAKEYDKVIYLDLDVILLDDIKLFYDEDLDGKALGVVPDIIQPCFAEQLNPRVENQNFGKYFCAGVLLINCKKFRENNLIEKYFEIAATEFVATADQDILNILCKSDCQILDQKYDVIYKVTQEEIDRKRLKVSSKIFEEAAKHAVIRHYADIKPWKINEQGFARRKDLFHHGDWWYFAAMSPFYPAFLNRCITDRNNNISCINYEDKCKSNSNRTIYLFGLPILKIKFTKNKEKYYLFNQIKFLTIRKEV